MISRYTYTKILQGPLPGFFMSSLIERGHVVLVKMMKMLKFTTSFFISKSLPHHSAQVSENCKSSLKRFFENKTEGAKQVHG